MTIDLSVIIASYNTSTVTADCVESVLSGTRDIDFEVIVVDDCSTDDSADALTARFPDITVLVNPQNVHYAKTNNRGLQAAKGRYAVLLNSDTIMQGNALGTLVHHLDANPGIGAAGPKLLNPDGTIQYCVRSFPGPGVMLFQAFNLQKLWPGNPITERYYHLKMDYERTQEVESLGTTAFMVRRDVWENVGMLDERFKIAFVDLAFCRMLRLAGVRIDYVAEAEVVHLGSQSINLSSANEVRGRAAGLRLLYDNYLSADDRPWKRFLIRQGVSVWGVMRRLEYRFSRDKRVITGPGAPRQRA